MTKNNGVNRQKTINNIKNFKGMPTVSDVINDFIGGRSIKDAYDIDDNEEFLFPFAVAYMDAYAEKYKLHPDEVFKIFSSEAPKMDNEIMDEIFNQFEKLFED